MKCLLIEDDRNTAGFIRKGLEQLGHTVDWIADGHQGLLMATDPGYGVLIIDRMLPRMDGLSIVKTLRASAVKTPVLFLTTLGGIDDRVEGLEAGGDDYIVKPFAFSELAARLNALARRPPLASMETVLRIEDLVLDRLKHQVYRGGEVIAHPPGAVLSVQ